MSTFTATIWTDVDDRRMVVTETGPDYQQGGTYERTVVDTEDLVLDWSGKYIDREQLGSDGTHKLDRFGRPYPQRDIPMGEPPILWDTTARKHGYRLAADEGWQEGRDGHGLRVRTAEVEPATDEIEVRELADVIRETNAAGTTEIADPDAYAAQAHRSGHTAATYRRHIGGTLTTRQAAELADTTPDRFRALVSDARRRHSVELQLPREQWPDARTPLYDAEALRSYLAER